jgi:hypothetical protein
MKVKFAVFVALFCGWDISATGNGSQTHSLDKNQDAPCSLIAPQPG